MDLAQIVTLLLSTLITLLSGVVIRSLSQLREDSERRLIELKAEVDETSAEVASLYREFVALHARLEGLGILRGGKAS